MFRKIVVACLFGMSMLAFAGEAPPAAEDPALEKRVMAISEELRCLVCQNQTIADSHADLAIDLKNQVRKMLKDGKSEKEVKEYMVQRYGDFVLYRPPVKATTWFLWVGPFLLLIGALGFLGFKVKQRGKRTEAETPMSAAEQQRASDLLAEPAREREGA